VRSDASQTWLGDPAALLANLQLRLDSLYSESRASQWSVSRAQFVSALERSVRKRFSDSRATQASLKSYLETLHNEDLALACGCIHGSEAAWEHFVRTYRPYLRAAAGVITRNSIAGTDLADSLFAELYGLRDGKHGENSLFRYFHGRSSLRTWLRTVLAQRHVDRLRQIRRWQPLDGDDGLERPLPAPKSGTSESLDPHRGRYLRQFVHALTICLAAMNSDDRRRLELYYARERTLAEVGRLLGEHESSVSRNLERARKELRQKVEDCLRAGISGDAETGFSPMSEAEIALSFQYASEDAPIDFRQLFPEKSSRKAQPERKEPV
jgi:RNA polymerase sigma-70 factor